MDVNQVTQFLFDYRMIIIYGLGIVGYAVFNFKGFKEKAMQLIFVAEEMAKKEILENGKQKEDFVYENLVKVCPKISNFLGEAGTRAIIVFCLKTAKDLIDDGKLNGSQQ
jgi:hypothetical protein